MYFDSFSDFFAMGGHGFYVWISYAIVLLSLLFYFVSSKNLSKKNRQILLSHFERLEATERNSEGSN